MINTEKLKKEAKKRRQFKVECFKKILNMIFNKIKIVAKTGVTKTWFEIPIFLLGYPSYEILDCYNYVEKKLKKNGFKCSFIEPNITYIDWTSEDDKSN